ncbi:MAG: hypothetical protein HFE86_02080 [Clostridiales bacterium]|nr:hypothetical protein [Clostridiales bacterium]
MDEWVSDTALPAEGEGGSPASASPLGNIDTAGRTDGVLPETRASSPRALDNDRLAGIEDSGAKRGGTIPERGDFHAEQREALDGRDGFDPSLGTNEGLSDREGVREGAPAPAFTVPVKYNKQYRELTPEEAGVYAQKGMKYDAMEPELAKLRQMAAASGRSLGQMIGSIYKAGEELARRDCMRLAGGNQRLADLLLDAYSQKSGKAYGDMLAAEQKALQAEKAQDKERLAGEFLELSRECPEIGSPDDLPDAVLEAAVRKGTSLTAEYLLYRHREERRVQRAEQDRLAAAQAAAGSMQEFAGAADGPALSAMLDGVWR